MTDEPERLEGPLPEAVRVRVVGLAADALGRLSPDALPAALRRVASFAPARRARLAGSQIAGVLEADDDFRDRVAADVREAAPELASALEAGHVPPAADPEELAAVAYLLRSPGWVGVVTSAAQAVGSGQADEARRQADARLDGLRRQVEEASEELKETRRRHREQVQELKAENADLRHKLGDARRRLRTAEETASAADASVVEARAAGQAAVAAGEQELRRARGRAEELERELTAARRTVRAERGQETLRARLLLDTLLETAQGLRRELALPAVEGSPADLVEATSAEPGARASSGTGSMAVDDPALLDQLLGLPRVHMVVDGYNVTKTAWPELSLERQRERLLAGLAPLVARRGAEVTVVFDAAETRERPVVSGPRGVRVLFSRPGVIADDVIRELVAVEPQGRPVVVVSSDGEVARDVSRAGARVAAALALTRLLSRA